MPIREATPGAISSAVHGQMGVEKLTAQISSAFAEFLSPPVLMSIGFVRAGAFNSPVTLQIPTEVNRLRVSLLVRNGLWVEPFNHRILD